MKSIQKAVIAAICFLCIAGMAAAEGAPTSQFGFKGWPYRNNTTCIRTTMNPRRTAQPIVTPRPTARPAATPAPTRTSVSTSQPSSPVDVGDYTTLSVSAQEYSAWNLLNADRQANGLPALPLDEELCAIARVKACDMNDNHYFSHTSPTYGRPADMLKTFGYSFSGVGENIAHFGTIEKAEAGFMSSSGHRSNILGSQWTRAGVGVCQDANGFVYVVQLFAR